MTTRLNANAIAPDALNALHGLQDYVDASSIEKPLLELVKVRASQILEPPGHHVPHAAARRQDGVNRPAGAGHFSTSKP